MELPQAEGGAPGALSGVAGTPDAAVVVVLNAAQAEVVLFGPDGICRCCAEGVVLSCAIVPPGLARGMAACCAALGIHYLDAPISGGSARAAAGVHIVTMAEALTFGMIQGVTPEKFVEVISNCAGTSWMLENRAPNIVNGDYTPHSQVNIWPKGLGTVLDIARSARFGAPITAAALQQFLAAASMGLVRQDDAAVAVVYARNTGFTLPEEA